MGRSKKLKAALKNQQSRLKVKEKAEKAASDVANRKRGPPGGNSKNKRSNLPAPLRRTVPFNSADRILLIGEGNFSYAIALLRDPPPELAPLVPVNVVATAYDTEDECYAKYPDSAQKNVSELRERGVLVIFGVDATCLEKQASLKGRRFERIVWNFPHAGKGIADQDRNILSNQVLLLDFFRSAAPFLVTGPIPVIGVLRKMRKKDEDDDENSGRSDEEPEDGSDAPKTARGTLLVTLRNVPPYTLWLNMDRDVPRLAKNPPARTTGSRSNPSYALLRSFVFHRQMWEGYEHRMTKGERAHGTGKTGESGEDRTWEFYLKD
ncbi:hypothetical protein FISHEDRAFT_38857 [Fistulina hepatica ATCC 64428]|uniref:25S rRNA (uridine-N(3))-methyltransferase BMT5-like domain-containing protein n=1 Tax=Fistulina hepatica ATCC 64428 TaxID=1128425 RepID=A0A0D7AGS3_9AGAR|nr:hypothetical protein FISHEDRAFT_38857 [Fistulina hepatica ATCC 64428]